MHAWTDEWMDGWFGYLHLFEKQEGKTGVCAFNYLKCIAAWSVLQTRMFYQKQIMVYPHFQHVNGTFLYSVM